MTLIGLPPSFGTQKRILESLRLNAEQVQQVQGHLVVNLVREDSRRRKRKKVW